LGQAASGHGNISGLSESSELAGDAVVDMAGIPVGVDDTGKLGASTGVY